VSRYISFRDFDWVLLGFVLLICSFGILEIYSATLTTNLAGKHLHVSQIYWVMAGLGLMFVMSLLNYQVLLENVHWLYLASIGSLLAVLIFGTKYLGARRWIKLPGGLHFQPSEWVKLVLILAMAKYFAEFRQRELNLTELVKA
jgi:rod shape determining protein RodA